MKESRKVTKDTDGGSGCPLCSRKGWCIKSKHLLAEGNVQLGQYASLNMRGMNSLDDLGIHWKEHEQITD